MRLLVFQHIDCEHPGSLRQFLAEDGVEWDPVELDQGEPIPDFKNYDALWVMGGPMDVWDTQDNPWLIDEKAAIRRWVLDEKKPYLGLCLGHQLLADALGGSCAPMEKSEIGILSISLNEEGMIDPLFENIPETQNCLQWHSVEITAPPPNSTILASSPECSNQAMRVGERAWSMQFHVEVEPDTVSNWGAIPEYKSALEKTLGVGAIGNLQRDADDNMKAFSANAHTLYRNFMQQVSA